MNRIKVWPHGILMILGCAVIAGAAALFLTRYQRSAEAKSLPSAARIERVDGQVGVNRSLDNSSNAQWIAASQNTPISVGDRLVTRDNSRSEIALTGRDFATVDPNSSLDVLDLSKQRTQLALRDGSALFDVGELSSSELFEVATPCGAIDVQQPGVYQVAIENGGNASATALSGRAQLVGQGGSGLIEKGETLSIPCQGGSGVLSRVDANRAGETVDSYYRYRYPKRYDGRYRNYYTYLDDPYYYEPSRLYNSYNYVSDYVPGVYDLDDYGDWQYVSDYGYCWHPRVASGWAPYQAGYWQMDYPFGLTWISNEPWGYAPYHYGRWAYASNNWFWVPESTSIYPTYSPALVAFIPFSQSSVAWVALGPGDPYASYYYDPNWQPVYVTGTPVIEQRIVNINAPGAVTVVPVQSFSRVIDPTVITTVDPGTIARVRPVLDPLTVDPLRRAAFQTREAQRRVDVPPALVQRINSTPVMTSAAPVAPPFRRDLARTLRVEQVGENAKSNKLQLRDNRTATAPQAAAPAGQAPGQLAAEQAREKQIADLSRQAARGDRNARQQMMDLRRQQVEQQRAERVNAQQAQGERVRQQMQQQQMQRDAARQQMITNQQQRRAAEQQQMQMRREQQQTIRDSQQQQRVRSQPQPARRPPPVQYQPQPQRQMRVPSQPQMQRAPERVRPQAQPAPAPVRVRPPQQQAQPRPQPEVQRQQQSAPVRVRPPEAQAQPRPQPQPQVQRQQQPAPQPQPQGQKKKPPEGKQ
jgi:hypothetical protein